ARIPRRFLDTAPPVVDLAVGVLQPPADDEVERVRPLEAVLAVDADVPGLVPLVARLLALARIADRLEAHVLLARAAVLYAEREVVPPSEDLVATAVARLRAPRPAVTGQHGERERMEEVLQVELHGALERLRVAERKMRRDRAAN